MSLKIKNSKFYSLRHITSLFISLHNSMLDIQYCVFDVKYFLVTANVRLKLFNSFLLISFVCMSGCTSVPYTNRSQLMLSSEKIEIQLGEKALEEVKKSGKISTDIKMNSAVKRVGSNIARATDKKVYNWEFLVLQSKDVNAFCLPGGKVVVFTGLFSYVHNDGELATILGHEIGHAIARHTGERLSHTYIETAGGQALSIALSVTGIPDVIGPIYSLGTGLGIDLPYSRTQEYEADHIGLILMAKAGYDPKMAIIFWERFSKESNYGPVKEFFVTHPMGEKRLEELKKLLPEAEKVYSSAPLNLGINEKI